MELEFLKEAQKDIRTFRRIGNKTLMLKIQRLLVELEKHPETGTGKPEQLRGDLSGYWSRRINREHRIIYRIDRSSGTVFIHSLKGHYEK